MKRPLLLICVLFARLGIAQMTPSSDSMRVKSFNFVSFDADPAPNIDPELISLTKPAFVDHPEFGQLPFNVGLDSVIEIIDKRTEFTRTLVKKGTNSKTFFQQGYNPINYFHNGWWRTIDQRLHPSAQTTGLFEANAQLSPTLIDVINKFAGVKNGTDFIKFNSNISLYNEDINGNRTLIANADWSNYTAGSQGVKVINIFPGIDMEMIVSNGSVKTNYIINSPISYPNGWLVIEDHPTLPVNETAAFTSSAFDPNGLNFSEIDVKDISNNSKFKLSPAYGSDHSGNTSLNIQFGEKWGTNNEWDIYVPVSWTGNSSLQFPLTIDPLVTSSATTLQVNITGSFQQNTGLFTSSCDYTMLVPTPANCTVIDVQWSFTYIAQNGAALCYGANRFNVGACLSPSAPGSYWFCNNCFFAGTCTGTNISIWTDVSTCIPAAQCASYNLTCINHFFARAVPNGPCSNFYIGANSNWVMTIQGQTINQPSPPASSAGTTICKGTITTLTATGQYGVAPYTYSWSPIVSVNQSVNVAPTVTTTYTCVITDACGITSLNSVTITVNGTNTLSPTPVIAYSMNPASGSPCPVLVTFCSDVGNAYGGGNESYIWSFPGGTVTAGGAQTGSAAGSTYGGTVNGGCSGGSSYTVNYTTAGSYWASFQITKAGACTVLDMPITICGALPIELISFNAESNNKTVDLNWITASETNSDYFTLECSLDGINFYEVGRVRAAGNSSEMISYHYTDENPPNGLIYYRLKQTDLDGRFTNSNIVAVNMENRADEIYIRPNPVLNNAEIGFICGNSGSAVLRIFDVLGQLIFSKDMECSTGSNSLVVDLSTMNKGIYFIRVTSGPQEKKIRFVKD